MVLPVKGSAWNTEDNLGFLNLGDYAESGDNVTSIFTALLAIGSPVYIPTGTWLITSLSIPDNAVVFGVGEKSVIKVADAANSINLSVGSGVELSNFAVDGNKINQAGVNLHTIQLSNSIRTKLDRIKVSNSKADSFNLTGNSLSEITLVGCSATGFLGNGIRVEAGSDISLHDFNAYTSDAVASGDGIAISSNGNAISNVVISNPIAKGNINRGISLLGNGSKNVVNVTITNLRSESNGTNGLHMINTLGVTVFGGFSLTNGIDGVRLEGDVQYTRITNMQAKGNTQFGMREVTSGATPNFNNFLYDISQGNGNNTITVVGASSTVVG